MRASRAAARRIAFIALARGQRAFGWAGWLGLVLMIAAAAVIMSGWLRHRDGLARSAQVAASTRTGPTATVSSPAAVSGPAASMLPTRDAIPVLLSRIEHAAVHNRLNWPRADYRTLAATPEAPGSIEIRSTIKGEYPDIRRFLARLLQDTPALTFKELALSRAHAESPEVEARLAIVIYLADPPSASAGVKP